MYIVLLSIAKLLQKISRILGNSGAAAPGLFIERVSPRFLEKGLSKLDGGVVVVSGTNGKTTTTKLIAESMSHFGERTLTNTTGSNMTRGLLSLIVSNSTWSGKLPYDVAVLEVDEAYASVLAKKVPVKACLVLNVMRDQLDRFGEIDSTAKLLSNLTRLTSDYVVLNCNDPRVATLETAEETKRVYFGVGQNLLEKLASDDEWHSKKASKDKTMHAVPDYELVKSQSSEMTIRVKDENHVLHGHFKGLHNHLNITAALALLQALLPDKETTEIISALQVIRPAFGRGEEVRLGTSTVTLLLVKNPSSFVQTLASADLNEFDTTSIVINDAYADSRDVSWLWDVDVSKFKTAKHLYTSGTRGIDMAVRLKYDEQKKVTVFDDISQLVVKLEGTPGNHAVFCTYTAMLGLRKSLVKMGHLEQVI
jgi:UDP-N-acetylmuramyl tripeptide synthase